MLTEIHLNKKNIIFDFWGTLAKLQDGPDFGKRISQALGIQKENYVHYVKEHWFKQCLTASQFADFLINAVKASPLCRQEVITWILEPRNRAILYDDVLRCLHNLSVSHELYLVSDNSTNGISIIENLNIKHFFKDIYLSCEYGATKEEGLFRHVFNNIHPDQTIVIGDSLDGDIKTAIGFGAEAIHIDRSLSYDPKKSINTLGALL